MQKSFNNLLYALKITLLLDFLFLIIMSLFRGILFLKCSPVQHPLSFIGDIFNAFFLGFRLDLVFIGYIQALITLLFIFLYFIKIDNFFEKFIKFLVGYYSVIFLLASALLASDIFFYSYFGDHINLLFFGVIDDDTYALWKTFLNNYNALLIFTGIFIYIIFIFFLVKKTLMLNLKKRDFKFSFPLQLICILLIILLNFLAGRGSLGTFPLGHMMPDISSNSFINKLPMNGVRAFYKAYKIRKKNKEGKYDLMAQMGYSRKIENAFKIHLNRDKIKYDNLLENIKYKTLKNEFLKTLKPNVIVIMVESFGAYLYSYNSSDFNILSSMKKHFEQDYLFNKFTSSGNSTIGSIESLVLNIPKRPDSDFFAESIYMQTSFKHAPAFVYKSKGYETCFLYGGDLSWRKIGDFVSRQGFDNVEGKAKIIKDVKNKKENIDHTWGVFDEHLYNRVLKKLDNADKPQFMVVLTTSNHPPHTIPSYYKGNPLKISNKLKEHIIGDFKLAKSRFKDYQYAVDMLGKFIDNIKSSSYSNNTIIAVTADNNAIKTMRPDTNEMFQSIQIPFYLYLPAKLRRDIDTSVYGSHKDIMPTLYNLSLSEAEYLAVGTNLLDLEQIHYGFNGSRMVFSKFGSAKVNGKNHNKTYQAMIDYYKATMAVTEYLIRCSNSEYYK